VKAKYASPCRRCGRTIEAGEDMDWARGQARHYVCPADPPKPATASVVADPASSHDITRTTLAAMSLAAQDDNRGARRLFLRLFAEHRANYRDMDPAATSAETRLGLLCEQLGCAWDAGESALCGMIWSEAEALARDAKMDAALFDAVTAKIAEKRTKKGGW
jgi:hypothetical protein